MSWLGALADIAIISSQVSVSQQMAQLQQQGVLMQLQGAQLAAIEAAQQQLRNEIFHFKNAAEELLLVEDEELPKRVAGGMKVLEALLAKSELTPNLFLSLADKEYAASASRLIRANAKRLIRLLPPDEQVEVLQIADLASKPQSDYGKKIMDAFFGISAARGAQASGTVIGVLASAPIKSSAPKPVSPQTPKAVRRCPKCSDPVGAQDQYCLNCGAKVA